MKKKIFKIVLIVIFIVLILFIINTARKVYIIDKYCRKLEEYQKLTNFYAKFEYNNDSSNFIEQWKKGDTSIIKDTNNDGTMRTLYRNANTMWILIENGEEKTAHKVELEEGTEAISPVIEDGSIYVEDNLLQEILMSLTMKITSENVDGKDCYKFYIQDDFQIFVNKEDLLKIKEINSGRTSRLVDYKINDVKDSEIELNLDRIYYTRKQLKNGVIKSGIYI